MLTHGAIAVFAGALGCVATLFTVGAFSGNSSSDIERDEKVELATPPSSDIPIETPDPLQIAAVDQLQASLVKAEEEHAQMAETLLQLSRELSDVQKQVQTLEQANEERLALALSGHGGLNTAVPSIEGVVPGNPNRRSQRQSGQQRVENLVAAGIDEQTARDLQGRRDQQQLARLELFDQAAREGWSDSDQLQQRLTELNADRVNLRDELGEDAYDRFLYESGDTNRVGIASVISGSAADSAGLEVGDSIVSYDNQRIFRVRELQQATRAGVKGEYVQVLFDRGGQLMNADLLRGPLGVTLETSAVEP